MSKQTTLNLELTHEEFSNHSQHSRLTRSQDIYQQFYAIGGGGGNPFWEVRGDDGTLVQSISVWVRDWCLGGIELTFTDGVTKMFGSRADRFAGTFSLEPGEYLTSLSIWGNGEGTRTGAFRMRTNRGREFFPKMYKWGLKTEYVMQVGSGLLCGAWGRAGADVDLLGFVCLKPIKDGRLIDVKYPTLSMDLAATTPMLLDKITVNNWNGNVEQINSLNASVQETVSSEWSISTALEHSVSATVKAGIPGIAEVEGTTTMTVSVTGTYARRWEEQKVFGQTINVTTPKYCILTATASSAKDKLNIPYTGTLVVELLDGTTFSYPVKSVYKGASVREIRVDYQYQYNPAHHKGKAHIAETKTIAWDDAAVEAAVAV